MFPVENQRRLVDSCPMARIESLSYRSNSPLAFCPVDGLFVATGAAVATGNAKLSFSHCGTNCPTCGGPSEILPGLYEPDGANIRLLLDPGVSPEALQALQKIIESVQAGTITPEQAIKEAEKVHTGWGRFFDVSKWSNQSVMLSSAFITALGVIIGAKISPPPAVTVIVNPPAIVQSITPKKRDLLGSTAVIAPSKNYNLQHRPEPHKRTHR
jgi:hypothetical protein